MAFIVKGLVSDGTLPATAKSDLSTDITTTGTTVRNALKSAADVDVSALLKDPATSTGGAFTAAVKAVDDDARAGALAPAHAGLAGRFYDPFNIVFLGDSFVEGVGASTPGERFVSRFLDALRNRYPTPGVTGGPGYIPARANTGSADPTVIPSGHNAGRGFSAGNTNRVETHGLGRYGYEIGPIGGLPNTAATGPGFVKMIGQHPMTSFDLCLRQINADAQVEVSTDDGVTWVTQPAQPLGEATIRVTLATRGTPTLRIRHKAGGSVVVEGIMSYDGDETKGIRMWMGGLSGSRAEQFTSGPWVESLKRTGADLVVIEWLTNDSTVVSSAAYKTAVQTIVTNVRAQLPNVPILLCPPWQRGGTLVEPWGNYLARLEDIAAATSRVAFVNLTRRQGNDPSILSDGLHPSNTGHVLLGEQYARLLTS